MDAPNFFTFHPSDVVAAGGLGLLGGAGAQFGKQLYRSAMGKDVDPVNITPPTPANVKIPVDVSPEEAEELKRQGIAVKSANLGFLDNAVLAGGVATPAAWAGWKGVQSLYSMKRKSDAQARLDTAKQRVQGLLDNQPVPGDEPIAGAMKTAEDAFFHKEAFGGVTDSLANFGKAMWNAPAAFSYAGIPIGVGAALTGAATFNDVMENNKYKKTLKAIKNYQEGLPTQTPVAEMEPVLRRANGGTSPAPITGV